MGTFSVVAMIFTAMISIVLPIGLIIFFKRKYKVKMAYFFVGIMVFTVFQLFFRIPLLKWLSGQFWFTVNIASNSVVYILFLSLTAGIFEEVGRYLAFKLILRDNRSWENGVAFGIGHGGIEAILIVGINYLLLILISINLNFNLFDELVKRLPDVENVINILMGTSPQLLLIAGIERLFTIIIHIGLSVFVLDGVRTGRVSRLYYSIGLHTLLNCSAIFSSYNTWIAEGIVGVAALISLLYLVNKKRTWEFMM